MSVNKLIIHPREFNAIYGESSSVLINCDISKEKDALVEKIRVQHSRIKELEDAYAILDECYKDQEKTIKELEGYIENILIPADKIKVLKLKESMPQCFRCGYVREEFETDYTTKGDR